MTNSLFFRITMLFAVAFFGFGISSYHFIKMQKEREDHDLQRRYEQFIAMINQIMRYDGNAALIEGYIKELGFSRVESEGTRKKLEPFFDPEFQGVIAKIIRANESIYLLLQTPQSSTLYYDSTRKSFANYYLLTFLALLALVFVYMMVLKSLMPLKHLRREIRKFADGKSDIHCIATQNDEIGEVAHEFNNAVQKIIALNESRHLFLRAIMHELKTPLAKGRIVTEILEDEKQKTRLTSIFERLNTLIDEFAKIEEMSSKNYAISKNRYRLHSLLHHILKDLMIETDSAKASFDLPTEEVVVYGDFEMLSLAVKNLLDNAQKYTKNCRVSLYAEGTSLIIQNCGDPMPLPIDEYFKPFFKDRKNPKSQGMGLGLYIVKNILEAQGLGLEYEYVKEMEMHRFKIKGVVVGPINP